MHNSKATTKFATLFFFGSAALQYGSAFQMQMQLFRNRGHSNKKTVNIPRPAHHHHHHHRHHHHHHHHRITPNNKRRFDITFTQLFAGGAGSAAPRNAFEGIGRPSKPGWRSGRLEKLTEWAGSKEANRPIICEYEPQGFWLWTKWRGTVLKMTYGSVLFCMGLGIALDWWARKSIKTSWPLLALPPASEPVIQSLAGLKKLWEYQLTLATFIVTFFLSHAYGYWQKVYNTTRMIQGRINDFCMLLSMGAERGSEEDADGMKGYSDEARNLVKRCYRLIRLSHTLFWAATPTASNGLNDSEEFLEDAANCPLPVDDEHIGPLLLSPYGLRALVTAGQLTKEEFEDLGKSALPPSQYAFILLVWTGLHCMDGLKNGILRGGNGYEENLLRQLTSLRASMFDIDDFRAGRMPLAYVQMVQVLVDSLVLIAPFALYAELGSLSIPVVGLLAFFFRGLLTLSKSFLDPFGVEGFTEQNIRVDVLVSELNFGASTRWLRAGRLLPGSRRINGLQQQEESKFKVFFGEGPPS